MMTDATGFSFGPAAKDCVVRTAMRAFLPAWRGRAIAGPLSNDQVAQICSWASDWGTVLQLAPPVLEGLAEQGVDDGPSVQQLRDRFRAAQVLSRLQRRLEARVSNRLTAAGLPWVALKGSAVRHAAYDNPSVRCGHDIDIGTDARHLDAVQAIAENLGFIPAQWNPDRGCFVRADPHLRARVEARHYELGFLIRRQRIRGLSSADADALQCIGPVDYMWFERADGLPGCYLALDVHHRVSLDIEITDILRRREAVRSGGETVIVPPKGWMMFYSIFKLYWEGVNEYGCNRHQYADLLRLVPRMDEAACRQLLALLDRYRMEAAAHYVLRRLPTAFGMSLPPLLQDVVNEARYVSPGTDARAINDRGDVWPKLWGYR